MSRIQEHLDQWAHNRAFIQTVEADFPDWLVTAALYAALHAIEAILTADGAKPRSRHQDRFEILQSEQRYQKIYECFHVLYGLSHVTRYSANPSRWMPAESIQKKVIGELVYPIETSVRKLLAAARPPITMAAHTAITVKQKP